MTKLIRYPFILHFNQLGESLFSTLFRPVVALLSACFTEIISVKQGNAAAPAGGKIPETEKIVEKWCLPELYKMRKVLEDQLENS